MLTYNAYCVWFFQAMNSYNSMSMMKCAWNQHLGTFWDLTYLISHEVSCLLMSGSIGCYLNTWTMMLWEIFPIYSNNHILTTEYPPIFPFTHAMCTCRQMTLTYAFCLHADRWPWYMHIVGMHVNWWHRVPLTVNDILF